MTYAVHNIHTPPVLIECDGYRVSLTGNVLPLGDPLETFETLDEALTYQADKRAQLPIYTHKARG